MMNVKLEKTDELGVRKVRMKIPHIHETIVGPIRTVNSTETGYLENLSIAGINEDYVQVKLYESRKAFGLIELALFDKGSSKEVNEHFVNKLLQMKAEIKPESTLSIFRPHIKINPKTKLPFEVTDQANNVFMEMGIHADYDFVIIQDPGVTKNEECYIKRMESGREYIAKAQSPRKKGFIPLPTLDCRTFDVDTIKARCKKLKEGSFNAVNIVAGTMAAQVPAIEAVGKFFSDKDVALIGSNIPKYLFMGKIRLNAIHLYQTYGLTTLSSVFPKGFVPTVGRNVHYKKNPLRFDRFTGYFLSRGEHNTQYGEDIKCTCPLCIKSKTLTGFYEDHLDYYGVTALKAKAHEVFASIDEFNESRDYIGEMESYFKMTSSVD